MTTTEPPSSQYLDRLRSMSHADLLAEAERLVSKNQELNRRTSEALAPLQSRAMLAEQKAEMWKGSWIQDFHRMCMAHTEVQMMFEELGRAFDYPSHGYHSVMDHVCGGVTPRVREKLSMKIRNEGVYANCFESKRGGMVTYRVLDEVRRAVDELLQHRQGQPKRKADPLPIASRLAGTAHYEPVEPSGDAKAA